MLLAQVWTFWIGVAVALGAIGFVLATIVGYITKVVRPKYPPRGQG